MFGTIFQKNMQLYFVFVSLRKKQMKLANKKVLISGGSRGIGAATALRLASDGADIALSYSTSADAANAIVAKIKALGRKAYAFQADAKKPETMPKLVEEAVKALGGLNILVNNAGVFTLAPIGEETAENYRTAMAVNVDSVFMLTNEAVKHMQAGDRIISISSALGARASGPNMSTYVATKFAVNGFTRGWAKDLGPKGILVNAVLPGPVDTEMNPANSPYSEYQKANTALGRYAKPEEIANAVAFLAGPEASYITGATLAVDGGWNA
jgi:3-oxoacyl-[acyl-carrier protein] reductase